MNRSVLQDVVIQCLGLLVVFVSLQNLQAQPFISAKDIAKAGDTVRVSRLPIPAGFNAEATGRNITLDFSQLTPQSQERIRYTQGSETPYGLFFSNNIGVPTTDLAIVSTLLGLQGTEITNVYNFYTLNERGYRLVGRGLTLNGFAIPAFFTDPDEVLNFPVRFGESKSSTFRFAAIIPGGPGYISAGTRRDTMDGWGTILTPRGSYNCLRVRSVLNFNDTLILPAGNPVPQATLTYTRTETKWYAENQKIPVVQINRTTAFFGLVNITEIIIQDINRLPIPRFTSESVRIGCKPLTVDFINLSERATSYLWDFGDGNTSIEENPSHVYLASGDQDVTLTATNELGSETIIRSGFVALDPFKVDFIAFNRELSTSNPTAEFANLTQAVKGGTVYHWDFGDGTTSTERDPIHRYPPVTGFYTVTLRGMSSDGCADTAVKSAYISVFAPTGITNTIEPIETLHLSPNPTTDRIVTVRWAAPLTAATIRVLDVTAREVYAQPATNGSTTATLDLSTLPAGLYSVRVNSATGIAVGKIVLR